MIPTNSHADNDTHSQVYKHTAMCARIHPSRSVGGRQADRTDGQGASPDHVKTHQLCKHCGLVYLRMSVFHYFRHWLDMRVFYCSMFARCSVDPQRHLSHDLLYDLSIAVLYLFVLIRCFFDFHSMFVSPSICLTSLRCMAGSVGELLVRVCALSYGQGLFPDHSLLSCRH